MGVERIGDDSPEADAELLAMTIESLLASGLTDFQIECRTGRLLQLPSREMRD